VDASAAHHGPAHGADRSRRDDDIEGATRILDCPATTRRSSPGDTGGTSPSTSTGPTPSSAIEVLEALARDVLPAFESMRAGG
jgi:hypothetical protein